MILDVTANDLCGATVPFEARRVTLGEALWVHDDLYDPRDAGRYRNFSDRFSFLVPDSDCFSEFEFGSERQTLLAERYGGRGIGENGGGARCGNLGNYQLKGIGRNPLAGAHDNRWYAYGGLNARDAIYEVILAQVLDRLLPAGVARVFGVILTSASGAYYESGVKTWGAILVREACLRPGHLLRAGGYRPNPPDGMRIPRDVARVRAVNLAFARRFSGTRELVKWLGRFLLNSARQFGFAKLARVLHGGISPSNLSFDGRWVDLTNAGFVGGGENVGGAPAFYEEPFAIPEILSEVADTLAKYSDMKLQVEPLLDYYKIQLEACVSHYLGSFFGLTDALFRDFAGRPDFRVLVRHVSHVLNSGKTVVNRWPKAASEADPVVILQSELFRSLDAPEQAVAALAALEWQAPGFDAGAVVAAFRQAMQSAFDSDQNPHAEFDSFRMVCAIRALRRSCLGEYFFKGNLAERIQEQLHVSPLECRSMIEDSLDLANWMLVPGGDARTTIFESAAFSLRYCPRAGAFFARMPGRGGGETPHTLDRAIDLVAALPESSLEIQGHAFRKSLLGMLRMLPAAGGQPPATVH